MDIRVKQRGFGRQPAMVAFKTSTSNKSAKWPAGINVTRIQPECGPDFLPSFTLNDHEMIFTIGSCFARHIEIELENRGYNVPAYNFDVPMDELWSGTGMKSGILNKYTPHAMLNEIEFAFSDQSPEIYLVENSAGKYIDLQLHVDKAIPLARAVERRLQVRDLYRRCIKDARVIIITLGLVETWWDALSEVYLNETPSMDVIRKHPERFFFEVLSPQDTIDCTTKVITKLREYGRVDQQIVLTVSPVPFSRTFTDQDAIVANCYSKSVLRVAAENVVRGFDRIDYFPSFESVTTSERSITWEEDMIHVKREMVAFNVGRMLAKYKPSS